MLNHLSQDTYAIHNTPDIARHIRHTHTHTNTHTHATNHGNKLKSIPNRSSNPLKSYPIDDRKTSKNITQNTTNHKLSDVDPILDPVAWLIPGVARFRGRPDVRNLWGGVPPRTDVGLPWGTLGPIFFTFWKELICCKCQRFQSSISILHK